MKLLSRLLLSSAALAVSPLAQAVAADYDAPLYIEEAPEYVPVEVGSGWYLRGDVSYNYSSSYSDYSLSVDDSLFDNNLIGFGRIGPFDVSSFSTSESPISGSVGMGYHFNDFLRADVNVGRLWANKYTTSGHIEADTYDGYSVGCLGTETTSAQTYDSENEEVGSPTLTNDPNARRDCLAKATAETTAWNGLVNGYVDLGTYAGFTPYVGAGIGAVWSRNKVTLNAQCESDERVETTAFDADTGQTTNTTTTFLCRGQTAVGDDAVTYTPVKYNEAAFDLLYALNAGVSYQMSQNVSLDVGYQYLTAPGLRTYSISTSGVETRKGFDSHQLKVGLRYDIW